MGRLLGILIWGLFLWVAGPEYLIAHWEAAMVWFAALMLVPEGLLVLGLAPKLIWVGRIAGIMLPVAYLMPGAPALASVFMLLYVLFWVRASVLLANRTSAHPQHENLAWYGAGIGLWFLQFAGLEQGRQRQ